jgi:hypothetical protein
MAKDKALGSTQDDDAIFDAAIGGDEGEARPLARLSKRTRIPVTITRRFRKRLRSSTVATVPT